MFCCAESVSYQIGLDKGLIVFEYDQNDWRSTTQDYLAIGIQTILNNAYILRIDSADTNDCIEMEMVTFSSCIIEYGCIIMSLRGGRVMLLPVLINVWMDVKVILWFLLLNHSCMSTMPTSLGHISGTFILAQCN